MAPRFTSLLRLSATAGASILACAAAAQTDPAQLQTVTITGRSAPPASVAGFGDTPLEQLPLQAVSVTEEALRERGAQGLRELARIDASVSDAYNSVGYWDSLTVRGFVIDQRYNYRRDGLPITGETAIALDNKARLELLKGTSGIQAGTSAPGGLLNLVVKRPDVERRSALVELRGAHTALAAVDLSTRFGEDRAFGVRLNAATERLAPELDDAQGRRHLFALAGDWRLTPGTLIEAEIETSRRRQPSQPAFSLLGDRVPDANDIDPRRNLNDLPWSEPVVFAGQYASLRLTQRLGADWRAVVHAGLQRLRTDDRIAFPYGCSDDRGTPATDDDVYYADRYCPDGRFDLYDFRSEDERRRTGAIDAGLHGRARFAGAEHTLSFGVLRSRYKQRLQGQAFNYAGSGSVDGSASTTPDPTLYPATDRDERSTEFYLRDALQIGPTVGLWLGLRHTRIERASVQTDGSAPTDYRKRFTTPWLAAAWEPLDGHRLHASWGRGIESDVVPNLPGYERPGQALPPRKSRQSELGYRHTTGAFTTGLTVFRIDQPAVTDDGSSLRPDGEQVHTGLEAQARLRIEHWTLAGSMQWLRARREGSSDPLLDGSRPANVPDRSLRLLAEREFVSLPGLRGWAALTADSDRSVLPTAGSPTVPGWARIDLGASWDQVLPGGQRLVWRGAVDNATNRRAWQESPYQFDHIYLYPMAPRTWRVSVQADL